MRSVHARQCDENTEKRGCVRKVMMMMTVTVMLNADGKERMTNAEEPTCAAHAAVVRPRRFRKAA